MKHYILIEVRERPQPKDPDMQRPPAFDAGRLRKAIHAAAAELGVDEADSIVRGDAFTMFDGSPNPRTEAQNLFRTAMGRKWCSTHPYGQMGSS